MPGPACRLQRLGRPQRRPSRGRDIPRVPAYGPAVCGHGRRCGEVHRVAVWRCGRRIPGLPQSPPRGGGGLRGKQRQQARFAACAGARDDGCRGGKPRGILPDVPPFSRAEGRLPDRGCRRHGCTHDGWAVRRHLADERWQPAPGRHRGHGVRHTAGRAPADDQDRVYKLPRMRPHALRPALYDSAHQGGHGVDDGA